MTIVYFQTICIAFGVLFIFINIYWSVCVCQQFVCFVGAAKVKNDKQEELPSDYLHFYLGPGCMLYFLLPL
jgi:hypothetical protein